MATDYTNGPHRPENGPRQSHNPGMNAGMEAQQAAANEQHKMNQESVSRDQGNAASKEGSDQARDAAAERAALNSGGASEVPDPIAARDARAELNADIARAGKEVTGQEKGLASAARAEMLNEKTVGEQQASATMEKDNGIDR